MVKYVSQPQLFGKMLKLAVEFQDGIVANVDKSYRVVWSTIRYKKQVEVNSHLKRANYWKVFGIKIVNVKVYSLDKDLDDVETRVSAWFILRKKK